MSRKRQIRRLARILGQSRSSAEQFAKQINQILLDDTGRVVSIRRICSAASAVQDTPITIEKVLTQLGFKEPLSTAVNASSSYRLVPELLQCQYPNRLPDIQPDNSPSIPEKIDIEDLRKQALTLLMGLQTEQVTYAQIENVMIEVGLDPGQNEDSYVWLIDRLDQNSILVVEQVIDTLEIVEDLKADAIRYSQEISQTLKRILATDDDQQLLTEEQQQRLLEIYQSGQRARQELAELDQNPSNVVKQALRERIADGEKALEMLLWRNRRLVASIVLKYNRGAHHLEFDDLFQEGMVGLQRAIERFDLEMGHRLSTYATWWIRQAVTRAIADQERTIRVPVHMVERINQYKKVYNELSQELEQEPTELEIAARMNRLSPGTFAEIMGYVSQNKRTPGFLQQQIDDAIRFIKRIQKASEMYTISLNQPVGNEASSELGDFLPDVEMETPEVFAARSVLKDEIQEILDKLTERQRQVIIWRFGMNGTEEMTLGAIGQKLGLTRERIRQIQTKALKNLRFPAQNRYLDDFLQE